jgi:hypothetical protein
MPRVSGDVQELPLGGQKVTGLQGLPVASAAPTSGQLFGWNGSQWAPAGVYAGSGVPASGLGADGDYYLRTDTPGTTNQRIYVKSAGAWTGIL